MEEPAPDAGNEELPPAEDAEAGSEEELPPTDDTEENPEGENPEGEGKDAIASDIGEIGEKVQNTNLKEDKVKEYVGTFLGYFTDYFKKMPQEELDDLGDKIIKVNTEANIKDLEANTPNEPIAGGEEAGIEEEQEQCAECGKFSKYAESRGYDSPEKFMECDDEEKTNVVNDYITAGDEGMNDGDEKTISLIIKLSPDMLAKLKDDYGQEEYAEKIQPQVDSMNESDEDAMMQLKEAWGDVWQGIKGAGQAIAGAAKTAGTGISQAYHGIGVNPAWNKLAAIATDLGKQINAVNDKAVKAGQSPVKVQDILSVINKQLTTPTAPQTKTGKDMNASQAAAWQAGNKGQQTAGTNVDVNALKGQQGIAKKAAQPLSKVAENQMPVDQTQVQPNILKVDEDEDEKDFNIDDLDTGEEKGGEEVTPEETPEETPEIETGGEEEEEVPEETPSIFGKDAQNLGGGVVKPEGAGVEIKIEPDKSINISMSESEKKLRKYIREHLEVKAGLRKANLNESKKSPTLMKLDAVIDRQFKLYESTIVKKKVEEGVVTDVMGKMGQGLEGRLKKQRELKRALEIDPENAGSALYKAFEQDFKFQAGGLQYLNKLTPEEKMQLAQQAASDPKGLGQLKIMNDKLTYIPVDYSARG
jgi:hypothetical protein